MMKGRARQRVVWIYRGVKEGMTAAMIKINVTFSSHIAIISVIF